MWTLFVFNLASDLPPLSSQICNCRTRCGSHRCVCKKSGNVCGSYCHPGRQCVNTSKKQTDFDSTDLSNEDNLPKSPPPPSIWTTIGEYRLTDEDKVGLIAGEWLNDRVINAAQWLLKQQHPNISGFQATTLQLTRTFEIQGEREFVQIFNVNGNHWIAVSTVQCPAGVVKVYDSMHLGLPSSLKSVIADILHTTKKSLTIEYANVQLQRGGCDCGLLAIPNVTAICNGEDPALLQIDQDQTRQHLLTCLEDNLIAPFPARPTVRKICLRSEELQVYCHCRMPKDSRRMITCNGCKEKYHVSCVKRSPESLDNTLWFCQPSCNPKTYLEYTYEKVASVIQELRVSTAIIIQSLVTKSLHLYCTIANTS